MSKLKIALIGYGYWGPNLARALQNNQLVDEFVVIDNFEQNRNKAAKNLNVHVFESLEHAMSNTPLHGVVIATPASTHDELVLKSLELGLNVLVEKPMAMENSMAIKMENLAKTKNLVLMPGHTFIFNDAIVFAKNYIESGKLGEIQNIYTQRLNLGQLRKDVDVVWNLAPHDVSIANYLTGFSPISVSATAGFITNPKLADIAFISMKYPNGIRVHHHVSWLDPSKTRKVTVIGSKGMLIIDDVSIDGKIQIHEKYAETIENQNLNFGEFQTILRSGDTIIPNIKFNEPLKTEVQNFLNAILGIAKPSVSPEDGVLITKILNCVQKSITFNGQEVSLV